MQKLLITFLALAALEWRSCWTADSPANQKQAEYNVNAKALDYKFIGKKDEHRFGVEVKENKQFHHTKTAEDGVRLGCYGHEQDGKKYSTNYVADGKGYRLVPSHGLITVYPRDGGEPRKASFFESFSEDEVTSSNIRYFFPDGCESAKIEISQFVYPSHPSLDGKSGGQVPTGGLLKPGTGGDVSKSTGTPGSSSRQGKQLNGANLSGQIDGSKLKGGPEGGQSITSHPHGGSGPHDAKTGITVKPKTGEAGDNKGRTGGLLSGPGRTGGLLSGPGQGDGSGVKKPSNTYLPDISAPGNAPFLDRRSALPEDIKAPFIATKTPIPSVQTQIPNAKLSIPTTKSVISAPISSVPKPSPTASVSVSSLSLAITSPSLPAPKSTIMATVLPNIVSNPPKKNLDKNHDSKCSDTCCDDNRPQILMSHATPGSCCKGVAKIVIPIAMEVLQRISNTEIIEITNEPSTSKMLQKLLSLVEKYHL